MDLRVRTFIRARFVWLAVVTSGLFATVGSAAQVCGDVDRSGAVTSSDALRLLKRAVGLPVPLLCTGVPATGQTTAFGPGSDGDVRAGAPLSYVDNRDGTITDLNTGLMWEKKDDSGGIHDVENLYTWCANPDGDFVCDNGTNEMDGTIKTVFLDTLNDVAGGGANCFAGYCDWRIPNINELLTIADYGVPAPAIHPSFHKEETCPGCVDITDPSCSCTAALAYSSSTTAETLPEGQSTDQIWHINFLFNGLGRSLKADPNPVRAVRGGP